jgi:hypothetical protein
MLVSSVTSGRLDTDFIMLGSSVTSGRLDGDFILFDQSYLLLTCEMAESSISVKL